MFSEEDVFVSMPDGVRLALDVYRPKAAGRYPALLAISPYGKERQRYPGGLIRTVEAGSIDRFVDHGYAFVSASSRGAYPSGGKWNFFDRREQQDGFELVEWIARQPWCDGKVAMVGESYFAVIQYLIAATRPPSLKTIVPLDGWTDLYRDCVYQGGWYHAGFVPPWLSAVFEIAGPRPGHPTAAGWRPPGDVIRDTVLRPTDGPYYRSRSAYTRFGRINIPVYHMATAGVTTIHRRGQLLAYENIATPKRLLVAPGSPWAFNYSETGNAEMVRWLDYYLKGVDNGVMREPGVTLYVAAANQWRYEWEYPLARTKWTRFFLRSGEKGTAAQPPYGSLGEQSPDDEPSDVFLYPDSRPVVEANLPVLAYRTPPLGEDLEIIGPASLVLYASSTAPDLAWVAKIDDEAPDGGVVVVSKGWLRASHREVDETRSKPGRPFHPHVNPVPLESSRVYEFQIEIWPVFRKIKAGHRLRLRIASCDSRTWDAVNAHFSEVLEQPSLNTVFHNRQYPSHLLLPVIPPAPPIVPGPGIDYQPPPASWGTRPAEG